MVKRLWGFAKMRYRGLAKNLARAQTMFALANLYAVRHRLLPAAGEVCPVSDRRPCRLQRDARPTGDGGGAPERKSSAGRAPRLDRAPVIARGEPWSEGATRGARRPPESPWPHVQSFPIPMRFSIFCIFDHFADVKPRERYLHDFGALAERAEDLGFDGVWVSEHHFTPYGGIAPRPQLMLAHLAARTRRIRLGSAVSLVPFDNPIRLAEDFAFVDVLSGGRLDWGVGRGLFAFEYDGMGISQDEGRGRQFEEGVEIVLRPGGRSASTIGAASPAQSSCACCRARSRGPIPRSTPQR